jgi:hypothetical protein
MNPFYAHERPARANRTLRVATLAAVAISALMGARPTIAATPTPTPTCPSVITQSTSQAILGNNSSSCNHGAAGGFLHLDNSYCAPSIWRPSPVPNSTT